MTIPTAIVDTGSHGSGLKRSKENSGGSGLRTSSSLAFTPTA